MVMAVTTDGRGRRGSSWTRCRADCLPGSLAPVFLHGLADLQPAHDKFIHLEASYPDPVDSELADGQGTDGEGAEGQCANRQRANGEGPYRLGASPLRPEK